MKKLRLWQIILAAGIAAGAVISVVDYQNWRHAEMDKYGHGPGEMLPAWPLSQLYQNDTAKLRVRYPEGWRVYTYPDYRALRVKVPTTVEVVKFFHPREELQVIFRVSKMRGGLADLAAVEVKKGKESGWTVDGEQMNWGAGGNIITVIAWVKEEKVKIQSLSGISGKLVDGQWEGSRMDKERYLGTLKGMWESLVML